jgi:hypothetical protein
MQAPHPGGTCHRDHRARAIGLLPGIIRVVGYCYFKRPRTV